MRTSRRRAQKAASWKKAIAIGAGIGAGLLVALILADATEPYGTPET